MSMKEAWARKGCGNDANVTIECGHDGDVNGQMHSDLHAAGQALIRLSVDSTGNRLRACLACALLNDGFIATGKLWSIGDDGYPCYEIHEDTNSRTAIAALLSLSDNRPA